MAQYISGGYNPNLPEGAMLDPEHHTLKAFIEDPDGWKYQTGFPTMQKYMLGFLIEKHKEEFVEYAKSVLIKELLKG